MSDVLLVTILTGAAILVALLGLSIAVPRLRVWPLPDEGGSAWRLRRAANRVSGLTASVLSVAAMALAVLEPQTLPFSGPYLTVLGGLVFALGAAFGVFGFLRLGPDLSLGEPGALVSSGPYRFSRNPQYVGAVGVLLGFSTALGSGPALVASLACSVWYLVAPFAEEAWLREKLGASYRAYLDTAPRFFGLPARARVQGKG